jgi:hypothetical protein
MYNDLVYDNPVELKYIIYRRNYDVEEIDKHNMYHPIKDISKHDKFRKIINNK